MVNIGPLTAMISSRVWGTPANFKGFRVLALLQLLHRRRSTKVNQTLHDVWPSPGLLHYVYIFGGSFPLMEFCHVQNSLCIQVLLSPILAVLLHDTQAVGSGKTAASYEEGNYGTFTPHHFQQRAPPIFQGQPSRRA